MLLEDNHYIDIQALSDLSKSRKLPAHGLEPRQGDAAVFNRSR